MTASNVCFWDSESEGASVQGNRLIFLGSSGLLICALGMPNLGEESDVAASFLIAGDG